jgi:hypothetical protein
MIDLFLKLLLNAVAICTRQKVYMVTGKISSALRSNNARVHQSLFNFKTNLIGGYSKLPGITIKATCY